MAVADALGTATREKLGEAMRGFRRLEEMLASMRARAERGPSLPSSPASASCSAPPPAALPPVPAKEPPSGNPLDILFDCMSNAAAIGEWVVVSKVLAAAARCGVDRDDAEEALCCWRELGIFEIGGERAMVNGRRRRVVRRMA
eukprot:4912443-Lingulodinium_polyedra.AAC.1